ncbi:TetR/AcrR family transcriptional regulator [Brucella thiophenivorans]|uniref:TetR/AcrR family transcriptional regulator n=1 Tax=Brucella thiophenivorans TaxID=571255 RepID=UPI000B97F665|nr:TetR/AcrR family transcriptional regulator [Brucella thiophenivorans]
MVKTRISTRERIIEAAGKLFHAEGIRDVSVDTVAQNAGLTKRTLYYHFSSKDDLIAAYLEARDQPNLLLFQRWFAETEGSVADKVRGIFLNLARSAKHPKWKGCGFLRTSVELIQFPGHPAMIAARIHKMRVEDWLCSIFEEQQAPDEARILARQIILLLDGAFAVVLLHRDENYMLCAGEAAAQLINQRLAAPSAQNLEEAIRES